ncbi:MAG: leucine-rich repeat protein, partial [Solibacillus sp.]
MKKWTSIVLIVVMLWSQLGVISSKAEAGTYTTYAQQDGTLIITGYVGDIPAEGLVIPSTLVDGGQEKKVTAIGSYAFDNTKINNLTIPSTVKTIGTYAFMNSGITTLTFEADSELETIGPGAFWQNSMTSVTIPKSVTTISQHAFVSGKLETLYFEAGSNLKRIGPESFSQNKLTSFMLPDSVEVLEVAAFSSNKLTQLPFGQHSNIKTIERLAFGSNELTNITIPSTVNQIGDSAFIGNKLKKVEFQAPTTSLTILGAAFDNYDSQWNISPVTWYIEGDGNRVWDKTTVTGAMTVYSTPNYEVQFDAKGGSAVAKQFVAGGELLAKPTDPTKEDYLFEGWFKDETLQNVWNFQTDKVTTNMTLFAKWTETNPFITSDNTDGTVTITGYTGANTAGDVVIPDQIKGKTVTAIGDRAFYEKKLTSVTIPPTVKHIGEAAFLGSGLMNIVLPDSVEGIGTSAFENNVLTVIDLPESLKTIGTGAFSGNQLANIIIPSNVTTIGANAFTGNKLTNLTIPSNVKTIGEHAFSYNQLKNAVLPNHLVSIPEGVFAENQLEQITIPTSVIKIEDGAFEYNRLTSVTISENVQIIGGNAFRNNQLTTVTLPNSVEEIHVAAFLGNKIANITIPKSVKEIQELAFAFNQLEVATFEGEVKKINRYEVSGEIYYPFDLQTVDGVTTSKWFTSSNLESESLWGWEGGSIPKPMTLYTKKLLSMFVTAPADGGGIKITGHRDGTAIPEVLDIPDKIGEKTVTHVMTLPTPTKPGYTFDGWYEKDASGALTPFVLPKETNGKQITLYAKWSPFTTIETEGKLTIIDYAASETLPVDKLEIPVTIGGKPVEKIDKLPTPTKAGSTFDGWYEKDASGVLTPFVLPKETNGKQITLYAKWSPFT